MERKRRLYFIIGTNCSGKTSIARSLIASDEYASPVGLPGGSIVNLPSKDIIVIGKYPSTAQCGGCDTIQPKQKILDIMEYFWTWPQDIFMEGLLLGQKVWLQQLKSMNDVYDDENMTGEKRNIIVGIMNTSLETCFKRIEGRSGKRREQMARNGAGVIEKYEHYVRVFAWGKENIPEFKFIELDGENSSPETLVNQLLCAE